MKLPFLKKKQLRPKTKIQKYNNIARQRKMNIYSEKLKGLNISVRFPKKLLLIPVIILLVLVAVILLSSNNFRVKEVFLSGDKAKESEILQDLETIKGRNIFLLRASDITNSIKGKYENIERVNIYKYLPDKIEVEIVQSLPALVFSSFAKTTLVKKDGTSLGEVQSLQSLKLLDYELKVLQGEKDLNAAYIKDAFLSGLSESDRKAFKWEEVKDEDKEAKYNAIKDDISSRVVAYRKSIKDYLAASDYANLPFFFSYIPYEQSEQFFDAALEVSDGLKFRNLTAVDNTFTSQYTLQESMDSGKLILFSTKRIISEQFKDLDSIMFIGRYSDSRIIDLRSEKYSVIR